MEKTIEVESATPLQSVKRKDVLKRSATVLFSSVAAVGALEAVPLPASAQHVIGMALIRKDALPKQPVTLAAIRNRRRQHPGGNSIPPVMRGFAYVAVKANDPNPFTDATVKGLLAAELKFLAALTPKMFFLLSNQASPTKFGYDGELSRFGNDNSGDGTHGQDFYSNDKEGQTPEYYDVWLAIY